MRAPKYPWQVLAGALLLTGAAGAALYLGGPARAVERMRMEMAKGNEAYVSQHLDEAQFTQSLIRALTARISAHSAGERPALPVAVEAMVARSAPAANLGSFLLSPEMLEARAPKFLGVLVSPTEAEVDVHLDASQPAVYSLRVSLVAKPWPRWVVTGVTLAPSMAVSLN